LEITQNIVLIGIPGAGKSTIGVVLAKSLSKDFMHTDFLIQNRHRQSLQDGLDGQGYLKSREFEESEILQLNVKNPSFRETSIAKLQIPARTVFGV
jgi:shikimate kinase